MAVPLPTAPDFTGLAHQQAGLNQQAANQQTLANRPNQIGPGGMLTWTQGPNGQWTQNTQLTGHNAGAYDAASWGMHDAVNDLNGRNLNPWGSTDITAGVSAMPDGGFGADQKVIDAMRGLQQPSLQAAEDARRAQLAAQGITQGSRIGDLTERELGNTRSDADMKAILAGTQEYGNVFNRQMAQRQQGINENIKGSELASQLRNFQTAESRNRLSSLAGTKDSLIPKFGSFASATAAPPADIYGAAGDSYRAQLDFLSAAQGQDNARAAASDARRSSNLGLLGGAISGMGGLSGVGGMLSGAGRWLGGLFGSGGNEANTGIQGDDFMGGGGWGTGQDYGFEDYGQYF